MRRKLLVLGALLAGAPTLAGAQGYPQRGYPDGSLGYEREAPPPRARRAVGYNCEAVQSGITGPAPFACPLPGPRPLGVRCFCGQPVSAFSGVQPPLAGQVVP